MQPSSNQTPRPEVAGIYRELSDVLAQLSTAPGQFDVADRAGVLLDELDRLNPPQICAACDHREDLHDVLPANHSFAAPNHRR